MNLPDNNTRRPYTFDRVVRIFFTVCAFVAVIILLDSLKAVLLPFLVACLIAYMLEPVVRWNMRWTRTRNRFLPVALTLTETAVAITALCVILVPYIISETTEMTRMIRHYASTQIQIPYISNAIHEFIRENVDPNEVAKMLSRDEWAALIKKALSSSWNFLSSGVALVMGALSWLIVVLYVIFIMLDYEKVMSGFRRCVPTRHRKTVFRIASDIKDAMNRYFRGQFIIACIVGILFSAGFLIVGLPMGILLGLFIGALNMVPYLQLISLPLTTMLCIVCTASTDTDFWVIFWECMAVYVVVQCIQDLYLTPRIMGKAMGLNPAIILLSLSIWGSLMGFMGLIIALPLTTLLISYYNRYVTEDYSRENRDKPETHTPDR